MQEYFQLSLENGVNVDALGFENFTALHNAVIGSHAEMVQLLLENGADPTLVNRYGDTAIQLAQRHEKEEILEFLNPLDF
jgi:ankyrin repeat protein